MNDEYIAALDWIMAEHKLYQSKKWSEEHDAELTAEQWRERVDMGLDTPAGRQAVGKAAATAVAYVESVFRRYGSLPAPGFPSGELKGEMRS